MIQYTITDDANCIVLNNGSVNQFINKPFNIEIVDAETGPNASILIKSQLEQQVIKFSQVVSPVAANVAALVDVLMEYNNTTTSNSSNSSSNGTPEGTTQATAPTNMGATAENIQALPTFQVGDSVGLRVNHLDGSLLVHQKNLNKDVDSVTIKTDLTTEGTTNLVAATPKPSAASTFTPSADDSVVLENSSISKAAPGVLYSILIYNSKSSAQFFQLHNATTLPAENAVPIALIPVPAGGVVSIDFGIYGKYFSTGIVWCNSSTATAKTIGSADMWVNVLYK